MISNNNNKVIYYIIIVQVPNPCVPLRSSMSCLVPGWFCGTHCAFTLLAPAQPVQRAVVNVRECCGKDICVFAPPR